MDTSSLMVKMITSGNVDKDALGFLLAAAVTTLSLISRNLAGFLIALVANFLLALAEIFPECLKKLNSPSA